MPRGTSKSDGSPAALDGDSGIERSVAEYYTGRLQKYGASHEGVDWNSTDSQETRFRQLLGVIGGETDYSLIDYGCGYGALAGFVADQGHSVDYQGYDVSMEMVEAAREEHGEKAEFTGNRRNLRRADFCVASGVFNVRLDASDSEFKDYISSRLDEFDELSTQGFAFNMLTSWSEDHRMQKYLYYANPTTFFDLCKERYSRHVALLHDYEIWEFTIVVRKNVENDFRPR